MWSLIVFLKRAGITGCEICRGLNCIDEKYSVETHTNAQNMSFLLCRPCAERQAKTLGLANVVSFKSLLFTILTTFLGNDFIA